MYTIQAATVNANMNTWSSFLYRTQPLVVASELGAGRAGCFCAVALAHELLSESGPSFVDG